MSAPFQNPPPVQIPHAFSISAPRDLTDYSMSARDIAVAVKIAWKSNQEISTPHGMKITGWKDTAALSVTVFVSSPINEEAAKKAVRDMVTEIARSTSKSFHDAPEHLRPIATGIPCGMRIVGTPEIVTRKRPRHCGYISDITCHTKDAWRRLQIAFDAYCAANPLDA